MRDDITSQSGQHFDLLLARLSKNVRTAPNKVAVAFLSSSSSSSSSIGVERQLTYSDLDDQTTSLAQHLINHNGIKCGDRVVLVYPPSLDFMIAFLACCKANVIAVPVFPPNPNRRDSLQMFTKIVAECDALYALTSQQYNHAKKLSGMKNTLNAFVKTNRHAAAPGTTASTWPENLQWIVTDSSINSKKKINSEKSVSSLQTEDMITFLQFTSGSTSDPKGVMITAGNLAHNLTIITKELQAGPDTVVVSWLPQYHDMGLIGSYLGVLYCGGTGYYMSPIQFLQRPSAWIEAVSKFHATHLQAPNFAFKLTARKFNPSEYEYSRGAGPSSTGSKSKQSLDLSSVRHVINAAEPVDEESLETFYRTFTPFGFPAGVIYPTYGLAEHTVFVCSGGVQRLSVNKHELEVNGIVKIVSKNDDQKPAGGISRVVGCGFPARQNVNVKIVKGNHADDSEGEAVSYYAVDDDIVGEIWVSSPSKAGGYYRKEVETKHDFQASLLSDSTTAYLRTGDLGFLHQGELFICGRLKDLIIIGGRNYYPQDIEATAESTLTESVVRYGCSAAFTINPNFNTNTEKHLADDGGANSDGEEVALVMELREVSSKADTETYCQNLADRVRAAINQEHSLGLSVIIFLKPKTVPKTSSGKIARSWCRKGYLNKSLQSVYLKSYKQQGRVEPLEIEHGGNDARISIDQGYKMSTDEFAISSRSLNQKLTEQQMRALSKEDIIARLLSDVSQAASIPSGNIETKVALSSIMDSLTLSQFKGMLETKYYIRALSDEYLMRDTSTLMKITEIVKLGYAPDDSSDISTADQQQVSSGGGGRGLAGAMGCPPGVVCAIQ